MIVCCIVLVFEWYYISVYRVSALFVCSERSGCRGIALISFTNILLVLFMIVCRRALVSGWYYISIYRVTAFFFSMGGAGAEALRSLFY